MSTEDSNDSQKRMRAVLIIHPTLAYPFFSLIRPLFVRVLPKGGRICEGLLYMQNLIVPETSGSCVISFHSRSQSIKPQLDMNDTAKFFEHYYSSNSCQYSRPSSLSAAPEPTAVFNDTDTTIKEVQQSIRKSRASLAPSPIDQIPHIVFKKCPWFHVALLGLFWECHKTCHVPNLWNIGVIKLILKSKIL